MSSEVKCPGCGTAVFEKAVVDSTTGSNVTQLVNAGDGKFHECPKAKPAAKSGKPAATTLKTAAKPAPPAPNVEQPTKPPAGLPPKVEPTPAQLETRATVAAESNDVLCETAIDIMASGLKITYAKMLESVTKRMITEGVSKLEAVKRLAKDLNVDIEKQGVPVSKATQVTSEEYTEDVLTPEQLAALNALTPEQTAALTIGTHDDDVMISEYTDEELDKGVEIDFETWAATASRTFLSVEKAGTQDLTLKFIKGGKVMRRKSIFETEARDKEGNVILILDADNKPVMEPDGKGKGGLKPKVKKERKVQDWVPCVDRSGVEYLLNVNPGMRKMLGKFKTEAGGTFDCWFKLHGEGRGKGYKCEITALKDLK